MSAVTSAGGSVMAEAGTRSDEPIAEAVCADGQLLLAHRAGDKSAFARLVRSWAAPVYAYLGRAGVAPSERDDLFQDVFCKVHRAAHHFDSSRPFKPWLFAILVNTARTHLRARAERPVAALKLVAENEVDPGPSAESVLEAQETASFLESQLAELPLPQREVVLLCCVEQLPQRDVAALLGMPVNSVKTQLRRARLTMAKALARRRRRLDREVAQ